MLMLHVYACRAVRKIVAEYCERAGARVVTVNIPFPVCNVLQADAMTPATVCAASLGDTFGAKRHQPSFSTSLRLAQLTFVFLFTKFMCCLQPRQISGPEEVIEALTEVLVTEQVCLMFLC